MKIFRHRNLASLFAIFCLGFAVYSASEPVTSAATRIANEINAAVKAPKVITDIVHWHHPTKAIFTKYEVTLRKITITDHYPTFEVDFPFDPQASPNEKTLDALCTELLKANGQWPYALVSPDDQIELNVKRDRQSNKILIENLVYTVEHQD